MEILMDINNYQSGFSRCTFVSGNISREYNYLLRHISAIGEAKGGKGEGKVEFCESGQSRKRFKLEDFKVYHYLGPKEAGIIDQWLRYALACKVHTHELNLKDVLMTRNPQFYVFPYKSLQENSSNSLHFKQLKKIVLGCVNVDDEALKFFLHNCPLLEDLYVYHLLELTTLRVIGPFPSLKCLSICSRDELHSLEICNLNLVYLEYVGRPINFLLQNLPRLNNLRLQSLLIPHLNQIVVQFSTILEQSEVLKLSSAHRCYLSFPDVKLRRTRPKTKNDIYCELKEVEFVGFCGNVGDLEFIFHFVDNARALKKIILHRWLDFTNSSCGQFLQHVDRATKLLVDRATKLLVDRATKLLVEKVSSGIQVDFLDS